VLTARTVRIWYRTHKWTSLVCTIFLLVSCITGLPLIFGDEINHLLDHQPATAAADVNAPVASLDRMVATSSQRYPGLKVLFMAWDEHDPRVSVNLVPHSGAKPGQVRTLRFDTYTGNLQEGSKRKSHFIDRVTRVHTELFAGAFGQVVLGIMAVLFVIALVSGFVVYGPFMRKLNFGTYRANRAPRVKWFDLHNLLGIVTLCWALVVGLTGVMNLLQDPLFDLWQSREIHRVLAPYKGKPLPTHLGSLDDAVQTVREAFPNTQIAFVVFPNDVFGSPRHYQIWTKGTTTLTSRMLTSALIDVESGQLTPMGRLPWYLRVVEISRPLHFGDYGGLPLKILWALLDVTLIVVLVSGAYLWLSRRKTQLEEELDVLVESETEKIRVALE
jgi:uncharacterized iron-regulated membrane protein